MTSSSNIALQTGMFLSIIPFVLAIMASISILWMLATWMRVSPSLQILRELHRDQRGGVQSLSFVLTVPLFIFIMLFIVQLSQITIGQIGVEYAVYSDHIWICIATIMKSLKFLMHNRCASELSRISSLQREHGDRSQSGSLS